MTDKYPITPPDELVSKWLTESPNLGDTAYAAARWGADQELEACCKWMLANALFLSASWIERLRAARRLKPPTLKEQALKALEVEDDAMPLRSLERGERFDIIRHALEQLE
jgi:hypothetical protein